MTTITVKWAAYGPCGPTECRRPASRGCGAAAGQPCYDGRSRETDGSRHFYPRITKDKPCKGRPMPCGPDWPPQAGDIWSDDALRSDYGDGVIWHARPEPGTVERPGVYVSRICLDEPNGPGRIPAADVTKIVGSMRLVQRAGVDVQPPKPDIEQWAAMRFADSTDSPVTDPRGPGPRRLSGLRRLRWVGTGDRLTPLGTAIVRAWAYDTTTGELTHRPTIGGRNARHR